MPKLPAWVALLLLAVLLRPAHADELIDESRSWLAQHAVPIAPDARQGDRFAPFAKAIAGRRVVALGEQDHGDGNVFRLKAELVEYLHRRHGFDVILFESGLFDMTRIGERVRAGGSADALAPGSLFYMYARAAESRSLLRYIDTAQKTRRPLEIRGFESLHTGSLSQQELIAGLKEFLSRSGSATPGATQWPGYADAVNRLLKLDRTAPAASAQHAFFTMTALLEGELCLAAPAHQDKSDESGFWCHIVRSLRVQASDLWRGTSLRDMQSAANVDWLLRGPLKGKKVVIWAHNFHIARNLPVVEPAGAVPYAFPNMGSLLAERLGQELYVVSFTVHGGRTMNYIDLQERTLPDAAPGSLEALLHERQWPLAFIDLSRTTGHAAVMRLPVRLLNYETQPGGLGLHGYDGVFYLSNAQPATLSR